jgi:hypothetical protein
VLYYPHDDLATTSKVPNEFTSTAEFTPSIGSNQETAKDASTSNSVIRLESSVPRTGSNFIIRDTASGKVLIFRKGGICLGDVGGNYMYRWTCAEKDDWFGFQDPASHMFLGHDRQGTIRCQASYHRAWEEFSTRSVPGGGYNLLVKCWHQLRSIGLKQSEVPDSIWVKLEKEVKSRFGGPSMSESSKDKHLAQVENWDHAIVWQFIEV